MVECKDDDVAYVDWLAANPHGYVLNAERNPRRGYLILHRAACKFISRSAEPPANWTTGGYLKVCAATISEIEDWSRREAGGSPQPCGHCHPLSARHEAVHADDAQD